MVEDNLEISRIDLQNVADFLPYPFIIAENFNGVHLNTHLNEKFLEEISYSLEEIPTIEAWYEHAYPDDDYRRQVIENWNKKESESLKEGKVFVKMKSRVTRKDGSKNWYEIKATVIKNVHVVAFIDLEKEIALQEELKNINRNNDWMLSILSHDLRGPIANLMAISSLAASSDITKDEFVDFAQKINVQSTQVLELLDNTMNWAKFNFNAMVVKPKEVNLQRLLPQIISMYKVAIENKHLRIITDSSGPGIFHCDPEILTVIIRNLLSNAIKFTPDHGVISILSTNDELLISDSGIGIPQNIIDSFLNQNYFSRKGTNNEVGTGLGLQLVVNLAEKINCKLLIESEDGNGTKMRLVFNFARL
jgi:signal transduction histidine kinase